MSTPARSGPSGPIIFVEGEEITQGYIPAFNIAPGAPNVVLCSVPVFEGGGAFLLSADSDAVAAAASTGARINVVFTPTGGSPDTVASRLLVADTTKRPLRFLAALIKCATAGELKLEMENSGSQNLIVTDMDAAIQPVILTV